MNHDIPYGDSAILCHGYDPRNYGFKKLGELIKYLGLFTIDERSSDNSPAKAVYIRRVKQQNGH